MRHCLLEEDGIDALEDLLLELLRTALKELVGQAIWARHCAQGQSAQEEVKSSLVVAPCSVAPELGGTRGT